MKNTEKKLIVIKETLLTETIKLEDFKKDFPQHLKDYIDIIKIDSDYDISVCLYDEFKNNSKIKNEIKKAFFIKGAEIKIFFKPLLPF